MWLGEAEVAREGADIPHAQVCHAVLDLGQQRQAFLHERVVLDGGVRRARADDGAVAVGCDGVETGDALHVDERVVGEQAGLHREQQLGAASVERRTAVSVGEGGCGFVHGRGFV